MALYNGLYIKGPYTYICIYIYLSLFLGATLRMAVEEMIQMLVDFLLLAVFSQQAAQNALTAHP